MAERIEAGKEPGISAACKSLGVMRFQRSGRALSIVAAARSRVRLF
jgi:hypothetical protein